MVDIVEATATRQCRSCHQQLPLDAAHFHRHCNYPGGFRWICKPCRSQKRKEDDRERCTKATKTLLLRMARDIIAGRFTGDHVEVIGVLSSLLGGAQGIAKGLHSLVVCPQTPTRTQATILLSMKRMTERLEPQRQKQEEEHERLRDQMTLEELDEYLVIMTNGLMKRQGLKLVPIDGG